MNNKEAQFLGRRKFLTMAGLTATALAVSPRFAFAGPLKSERKIRIGIIGGGFGMGFFFHEHPNCKVEAVSDLIESRRNALMKNYRCNKSYESLEKLLKDKNIEAVFLATPAPDHARHVIASLNAGKHVLCAVPVAMTLKECADLKATVERTGLTYMMAETSYYRQGFISAKKMYKDGDFGSLISAAAEYNHPGLEVLYFKDGKPTWRHGLPPMLYPTHCTAFLVGLTGERLTSVSCLGWGDDSPILKNNPYKNPFWNETAFFKTSQNRPFRVEVNWRGAYQEAERAEWRGDKMSFFYPTAGGPSYKIIKVSNVEGRDDAGFQHIKNKVADYTVPQWWNTELLPAPLRHNSGHEGSHTFITHKFIEALVNNEMPEVNIYEAIAFTAPGIVAHQSALKGGVEMKIPNFDKKK